MGDQAELGPGQRRLILDGARPGTDLPQTPQAHPRRGLSARSVVPMGNATTTMLGRQTSPALPRTRWHLIAGALTATLVFTAYALTRTAAVHPTQAEAQRRATLFNHCNDLQVDVFLQQHDDAHYRAVCFGVAGRSEQARATLDAMPAAARDGALVELFAMADTIGRRGDVQSVHPIMSMIAAYQPGNRAAHAYVAAAELSAAAGSPRGVPPAARVAVRPTR